jgi:hypothetical protein
MHVQCPDVSVLGNIAASYLTNVSKNSSTIAHAQPGYVHTSPAAKDMALAITRDSLVYLGDLSRWRHKAHLDKQSQTPQWKKARLYYELAYEVDPSSGLAKHQLAVLAQDDGKYFPALASLYQSLASAYPHPQAASNLDVLMAKRLAVPVNQIILKVKPSDDNSNVVATLRAWFLQLHVHFFKGQPFEMHAEMEAEVLARLSQSLKDNTNLESTLLSMALINMAAEFVSLGQAKQGIKAQESAQMYFFCFRHNIKTFKVLLNHFYESLDSQARASLVAQDSRAAVPPISSVVLQTIRVYTLWFTVNWSFMQKCMEDNNYEPEVAEDIRQLWRLLAHIMNSIFEQYQLFAIPAVQDCEYLVDEEEATMGFLPVHGEYNADVWTKEGAMKPVLRRERTAAEQKAAHLVRLRDIYTRALLVTSKEVSFCCPYILPAS